MRAAKRMTCLCRIVLWTFALVFILSAYGICEEAVWVEEPFVHLTRTINCDGLPLIIDADVMDIQDGTMAQEYHLSRLSNAFARKTAESIDWRRLGFPLNSTDRWILDAGCFIHNDQYTVGVYPFCEVYAKTHTIGKTYGFLGLSKRNGADISAFPSFVFDQALQYAELAGTLFSIQLGTDYSVDRWDGERIRQLNKRYGSLLSEEAEAMECYDAYFPVYWNSLRLHSGTDTSMPGEMLLLDLSMNIAWGDDGIIQFSVPYFDEFSPRGKPERVLSAEEAIDRLTEIYSNLYLPNLQTVTVRKILLEYVAISGDQTAKKGFTLYPAWCFQMEYEQKEGTAHSTLKCIHAITGRQLK